MDPTISLGAVMIVIVVIGLYFLPTIIALARDKESGTAGVILVNLFLGWTLLGWLLAFVWAFTGRTQAQVRLEEKRHQEMLATVAGSGRK